MASARWQKTKHAGVAVRHQNACAANEGKRCACEPSYRATAWDSGTQKPVRSPSYRDINEAHGWLVDWRRGLIARPGSQQATNELTFKDLAEHVLESLERGVISIKRGGQISEHTLYSYRQALQLHVYPKYGGAPAASLTVADWQRLVDELARAGKKTNTVNNVLNPVRTIYRWACAPARGEARIAVNPTVGLELPARDEKRRDRIAAPAEAAQLLTALSLEDRVAYARAVYAGMRRKEIRFTEWEWIDFDAGVIHVLKTKGGTAGERKIPLIDPLRAILREWWMAQGRPTSGLVNPPKKACDSGLVSMDMLLKRARKLWLAAGLVPIGLHECRHTFASYLIAAGVNAKAVTTYMGHSSVDITFDRYGHLFPGNEDEAADMLNTWIRKAVGE